VLEIPTAVGITGGSTILAMSALTHYHLTVVTEELQEGDPEDRRSSIAIALRTRPVEGESLTAEATSLFVR
jgi:hypothetical protein